MLPLVDRIKVNVDAPYNLVTKIATLGMVVCDSIGTISLATVTKTDNIVSALHAEFLAILFSLEAIQSSSFTDILVESDSLLTIQEILKQKSSFCEWKSLISDIIDLSMEFISCKFSHVKRLANMCAHNIAQSSCELGDRIIWRNTLPFLFCNPDVKDY